MRPISSRWPRAALTIVLAALPAFFTTLAGQSAQQRGEQIQIDGRTRPDLITADEAWEAFFRGIVMYAFDEQGKLAGSKVDALARLNVRISPAAMELVLSHARDALEKQSALREPLEWEHQTGANLGWSQAEREDYQRKVVQVVADARETLRRRLDVQSFRAIEHYIAEAIVPGIKITRRIK